MSKVFLKKVSTTGIDVIDHWLKSACYQLPLELALVLVIGWF
jgi:hypothetical protein